MKDKDYIFTQNRDLLISLISSSQEIGIVLGENHTIDTVGAALSLFLSLQAAGKHVQIVSAKQPLVEVSNLVGIDRLKTQFDGVASELTVAIPRRGRAIEKVKYKLEGDWVHLIVVAGPEGLNFSENEIRYIKKGSSPSLVFAINVPTIGALEKFVSVDANTRIVNIDNSATNEMYGDALLAETSIGSITSIVGRLITELALPIDQDTAQNLLDGVVYATDNFTLPTTDSYAFETASVAMKHGGLRKMAANGVRTTASARVDTRVDARLQNNSIPTSFAPPVSNLRQTQQSQRVLNNPFDEVPSSAGQQYPTDMGSDSVPNDWFAPPKIFKGSGKGDQ